MEKIEIWLDSMKVALIEENCDKAYELTQNLPFEAHFFSENVKLDSKSLEHLNMVKELLSQAITLLESKQKEAKIQLDKIRHAKNFFN